MDYATAFIGVRTNDGKLKTYGYGYDNEIVPDIVLSSDWKELFSNASTREKMLSESFKDPWAPEQGLKETIEEFDWDGEYIKEYKRFMNAVKKMKTEDVDLIVLGVVHGGKGCFQYNWRILDCTSTNVSNKSWSNSSDSYNGPGEECIEEVIRDWKNNK